jgi:hypothetical protein
MSPATTLVLDTTGLSPIQPSGFVPPSQRVRYSDPIVQDFLRQAFQGQFPRLETSDGKSATYRHENPAADSFASSAAVASMQDFPQAEVMRLLQGWITLRKLVMEATVPEGARSLLLNLKIPDPRVAHHCYRVRAPEGGDRKLYVLVGFEGPAAPSVALEEGIAAMLNVPAMQLESLLATSMAPTGNTTRLHTLDSPAPAPIAPALRTGGKPVALLAAAAALAVSVAGLIWKNNGAEPAPANPPIANAPIAVEPPAQVATAAATPTVTPAVPAPEPAPAAAPVNLDAMTGAPPARPASQDASDLTNLMTR